MTRSTRHHAARDRRPADRFRTRPRLEGLEDRRLLSTTITEFPVPTASAGPYGITAGPDGNLWFTEGNADKIGEINLATHGITEFLVPTAGTLLGEITAGPDGNLWFTEASVDKIGKINPTTHAISDFADPVPSTFPVGIAAGPDGNLWFTGESSDIRTINPTGAITVYPVPYANSRTWRVTAGPDGNVWFTDRGANAIGVVTLNQTTGTLASTKSSVIAVPTTTKAPDPLLAPLVLDSPDLWEGLGFKKRSRSI